MATPRHRIFDPTQPVTCHCVSRCVRRIGLLNAEKRRRDLRERLEQLVRIFAIDVLEWAILPNHFHLVASTHPDLVSLWSDQEVARRYRTLSPDYAWRRRKRIDRSLPAQPEEIEAALADPELIVRWRRDLADLSTFHKFLKQKLARIINLDDDVTGHCFEGRFKSIVALDAEAVIAHMVYVALNPVRASLAGSLDDYEFCSLADRIEELRTRIRAGEFAGEVAAAREKLRALALQPALPCTPGAEAERAGTLPCGAPNPWFGGRVPTVFQGVTLAAFLMKVDAVARVQRANQRGVIPEPAPSPLADLDQALLDVVRDGGGMDLTDAAACALEGIEPAMSRGLENPLGTFSGSTESLAHAARATGRTCILGIAAFEAGRPRRVAAAAHEDRGSPTVR